MTGKPFHRKNNDIVMDEAGKKKTARGAEGGGSRCDFQGYHHRRQKELIVKIVVSIMGVNPSADKKSTHPPLNP